MPVGSSEVVLTQSVRPGQSLADLRLTIPQSALLAVLPDSPSDGRCCKGPAGRVAMALVDKGYAKCVGRTMSDQGYFARTVAGEAASAEYKAWVSGVRTGSGARH